MRKIRILVVDDDVISRTLLRAILGRERDLELVGVASNGKAALRKIPKLKPDLVTLDVEMPEMDGLETMRHIHEMWPDLPVIMFSGHTGTGDGVTMEALSLGASDFVTKPESGTSASLPIDQLRADFLPRIRAICGAAPTAPREVRTTSSFPRATKRIADRGRVDILAIGVSTGGPNALAKVLPALDPALPVPVVLVQHMPPSFTRLLAERLDKDCALTVTEARPGEVLRPGHVYIAPGDHHMLVHRSGVQVSIRLNQDPAENSCRPSVDPLFCSVAEVYGSNVLGVVLTGMGRDGLLGSESIKRAGGEILIQDEATSVVWGMPGAIASRGLADAEVSLDEIAAELNSRVRRGRSDTSDHAKAG